MYYDYQNQAVAAYSSLYFFIFLSNSNMKTFRHTFLRNCEAYKVETWYTWTMSCCIVYTKVRLLLLIYPFISSFFFPISSFVKDFSGTTAPRNFEIWYKCWVWLVVLCLRESASSCLSFPLFVHLSFSSIKNSVTEFAAPMTAKVSKFCIHFERGHHTCDLFLNASREIWNFW